MLKEREAREFEAERAAKEAEAQHEREARVAERAAREAEVQREREVGEAEAQQEREAREAKRAVQHERERELYMRDWFVCQENMN